MPETRYKAFICRCCCAKTSVSYIAGLHELKSGLAKANNAMLTAEEEFKKSLRSPVEMAPPKPPVSIAFGTQDTVIQ